jgi:hypothetical protein
MGDSVRVKSLLDPKEGYLNQKQEITITYNIFPIGVPRKCNKHPAVAVSAPSEPPK